MEKIKNLKYIYIVNITVDELFIYPEIALTKNFVFLVADTSFYITGSLKYHSVGTVILSYQPLIHFAN